MAPPWIVDDSNAGASTAIATWWLLVATVGAAFATLAAVVAAFAVQLRQFGHDRREKEKDELRRSRTCWIAVNQALSMLELLLSTVRAASALTPVNWTFLQVGAQGAVVAADQALAQEVPNLDMLNLAIHAQTLANSFSSDLDRRARQTPMQTSGDYLESISGLEQSLIDQRKVASRLKKQFAIEI